ncbi:MAG: PhoH family protein [Xanthomonadales bacterium]|nr:PhoH family protein [Gammaproteobacteria bacterium]MBT8054509.1 PhoH family protein [Gammaproteobacteria bacterium]NND56100.1 PhoH family protein [Xanthomonadales bacterium]NNK52605.1 PhoH family protein [Xanthomonadales bacterium]
MGSEKRLYILDTNVLMHDPTSIFRFEEHDVLLPMMVLEELDAAKKGLSEVARNVRQVSRFIGEMMQRQGVTDLEEGLELKEPEGLELDVGTGRLFFQTTMPETHSSLLRDGSFADNEILSTGLALREAHPEKEIVLVSKDINLRIKAAILGVQAEDYYNDRALDDLSLLYRGLRLHDETFWEDHPKLESWSDGGRTHYRIPLDQENGWYPNQCIVIGDDNGVEAMVKEVNSNSVLLKLIDDYYDGRKNVWGIHARNLEQNFALNLLMDPDVDFVTLMGTAGTGKTLLALAAGLSQTMDNKRYSEIIVTRATVSIGEDIGYLPGTEEEKMTPWMGALTDNFEVLTQPQEGGEWGRAATNDLLASRVKVRALNFMRGRTFLNRYVIIDEAQNITPKQMKALVTRAGPGTKIVCLGNVEQIDTPYLTETTSGLTFAVDRFKTWEHAGHITLRRGERSRLADFASETL